MTVAALEESLEPLGLALGVEVPDPKVTSLGACFADARGGLAGPAGVLLRDRCIGLSFIDGNARLFAAGSRVVKNVAGFDFGRLHHGARGSLGLVLDLTLRLVARPKNRVAVWWACERDELPRKLPELRAAWGHDAWAEVWIDRVASARFGLPGEGIVFRQAGVGDLLQERMRRTNAADVSDRWAALLGASLRPVRACPVSELAVRDPGTDCVVDLGFGLLRARNDPSASSPAPSRAALAVKRVLDPHGIWPALPGTEAYES
jgi:glycolate oxidase FAD binding subunit